MSQIRADPSELAQTARKFGDLAVRLSQLAADTVQAAESAPSYEGQFAPQVQAMSQDAQSRLSHQAERLRTLGEELAVTASAFESADQQSIQGFEQLVLQFRGLLDGLGQLLPGGLGATVSLGQPLLGLQQGATPPEPPTDEGDDKSWLDRFIDQIRDPEFFWDLVTDKYVAARARAVKSVIPVTLVLPMLKGFGMDDVAGPLVRTFDSSFWIRSVGRLFGDASAAPLFVAGWGISTAPEQIQNIRTGAPWNEFVGDWVVDSGIYLGSEGAGWVGLVVGNAAGGPAAGFPLKFAFDLSGGAILEYFAETHDWRGGLANEIAQAPAGVSLWFANAIDESIRVEIPPIPTPPELYSAAQTPVPPSVLSRTLPSSSVPATATPAPPSATSEPRLMVAPPPGEDD